MTGLVGERIIPFFHLFIFPCRDKHYVIVVDQSKAVFNATLGFGRHFAEKIRIKTFH